MTFAARWCLAVPATTLASLVVYYVTARALVFVAVALLEKSATVDVSLGIALHYQHGYFVFLSALLAVVSVGLPTGSWRRRGFVALGLMLVPPVAFWAAMIRDAPNWSMLVFASTGAGVGTSLLLGRAVTRRWASPIAESGEAVP